MATRDELLEALVVRYREARRADKGRILTEFAEVTGYHRKHARSAFCAARTEASDHALGQSAGFMTMRSARR